MSISYAVSFNLACPACGQEFATSIWWLIDISEQPDLLAQLETGKLHNVTCPHCNQRSYADAPILLYRPNTQPPLIYSPSRHSTPEEDHRQFVTLLAILRQGLEEAWEDELIEQIVIVEPDSLGEMLQKEKRGTNRWEANLPEDRARYEIKHLSRLLQIFFLTATWPEALRVLLEYPELLSKEADILMEQLLQALRNPLARQLVQNHRILLERCREIGMEEAFAEKEKEGLPKIFPPVVKTKDPLNSQISQKNETPPLSLSLDKDSVDQITEVWDKLRRLPDYKDIAWPN